jgi:hypothetical protein
MKKWKLLVCKALELGYNNFMLVDELLDGGMQAESSFYMSITGELRGHKC